MKIPKVVAKEVCVLVSEESGTAPLNRTEQEISIWMNGLKMIA